MFTIESNMASEVEKGYKPKGKKNLHSFQKIEVTKEWIDSHKEKYPELKHLRPTDRYNKTFAWMDKDALVAYLNIAVESPENTNVVWISNIRIQDDYKGYGLSKQLLDYATKTLHANHLGVAKDNKLAQKIYKDYGFRFTTGKSENGSILYMSLPGATHESVFSLGNYEIDSFLYDIL